MISLNQTFDALRTDSFAVLYVLAQQAAMHAHSSATDRCRRQLTNCDIQKPALSL